MVFKVEQLSLFTLPDAPPTLNIPKRWEKSYISYNGVFEVIAHRRRAKNIEFTIQYEVFSPEGEFLTMAEIITPFTKDAEKDFYSTVDKLVIGRCNQVEGLIPLPDLSSTCDFVGEQILEDIKKTAHQQDKQPKWVEQYWVKRGGKKFYYYRFAFMCGRKINRIYIGAVNSAIAIRKKEAVEIAIAEGKSPEAIKQLIKQPGNLFDCLI
jgi:hypothetical protein